MNQRGRNTTGSNGATISLERGSIGEAPTSRSCCRVAAILQAGVLLSISAFGQSLVESERIPAERHLFEIGASAPQLRCDINPVRPALNFGFRFQAGYTAEIPLGQFRGSGHGLTVHARVTPAGREPVYLTKTAVLPEVLESKAEAVIVGMFAVGEGTYGLEVLVEDDLDRFCRGAWQIQARRTGSERQLKPTASPGAVEDVSATDPQLSAAKPGPRIARLTILLHAAPLSPNLSALQPADVQRVVDSLSSLLRELPAQRVRLIAFNLDQRAVIFRKDGFESNQNGELTAALTHLELGLLDSKVMRERPEPMNLLLGLVQAELRDPKPPDALIVMGPRTRMQDDVQPDALGKGPVPDTSVFGLQYQVNRPLRLLRLGVDDALTRQVAPIPADNLPVAFMPAADTIERLVSHLKGQTIPVRTPHDLADAIQHMDSRIRKTAAPATVTAEVAPSSKVGGPLPRVAPPPAASPSTSRPALEADPSGDEDPVGVLMRLRDQVVEHGGLIPIPGRVPGRLQSARAACLPWTPPHPLRDSTRARRTS